MLTLVKRELKKYLRAKGWSGPSYRVPGSLDLLLLYALGLHKRLHIIQVGAYDGVTNDPLRSFIADHVDDLDAVLFEPQIEPFERLRDVYRDHSNIRCVNKAISPPGVLTFYSVNDRYKTWYRQKTGRDVTGGTNSFFREHVVTRIKRMDVADAEVDQYIDRRDVEISELLKELAGTSLFHERTDLLQVDCEGMDDEVIYHSAIDVLRPRLINFDGKSLAARSPERLDQLKEFLIAHGYALSQSTRADIIAIKIDQ